MPEWIQIIVWIKKPEIHQNNNGRFTPSMPRIENYNLLNNLPRSTKFGNTACFAALTRCLFIRFEPFPSVCDSLLPCWLQHWSVGSACVFSWSETNPSILCNPITFISIRVYTRQVSFPSVNYWMVYNLIGHSTWIALYFKMSILYWREHTVCP
jgi:hypothetical protein